MDQHTDNLFRFFDRSLRMLLPTIDPWYDENLGKFKDRFNAFTDQERNQIINLFIRIWTSDHVDILISFGNYPTADDVFRNLRATVKEISADDEFNALICRKFDKFTCFSNIDYVKRFRFLLRDHTSPTVDDVFTALFSTGGYHSRNTAIMPRPLDSVHSGMSLVDDEFDSFYGLLSSTLPPEFLALFPKKYDKFKDKFKSLPNGERDRILTSLNGCPIGIFHGILRDIHRAIGDTEASSSSSPAVSHNEPYHIGGQPPLRRSQASNGNLPDHQREFIETGNNIPNSASEIQFYLQRPEPSVNNAPVDVGDTIIPDENTAEHSKYYDILVPANYTNAKQAFEILKFTYHSSKPFPIKTSGYLTVVLSCAALILSLVGLFLNAFRPNTFPSIMHKAVLHVTAYAFIGTMIHEYLQDDPFLMWIVAGLNIAFFNAIMWYIGRRG